MNYETRPYNQIIQSGDMLSYPEPEGMPAKYENWVKGRGAHLAPVLITRLGELMKNGEGEVLQNSIETAKDFHEVLGLEYSVVDLDAEEDIRASISAKNPSIFLYRNSEDVQRDLGVIENKNIIGNPTEVLSVGKEILHPESDAIQTTEDLLNATRMDGIPVAPGAVCESKGELDRIINIFDQVNKKYIFKDPTGTDGNGITTDISKIEKFPVVIEEKLDFDYTISVQYTNGVLGVLKEREKPEGDERWRGNTYPYFDSELGEEKSQEISNKLKVYAERFKKHMSEEIGIDTVIFGLDFAVTIDESGEPDLTLLDPNIRMPGNMYLYYQKEVLNNAGYNPKFIETALLYEDEVSMYDGKDLQVILDQQGIGLLKYDEEGQVVGINTDAEGNPDGGLVIVQDSGEEDGNNLAMFNVFGKDEKRTNSIIETVKAL